MEVYLDNAATTKVFKTAADSMLAAMEYNYGNPSSRHHKGIEAEVSLKFAKDVISKSLKVSSKEIIFTSGGTESNNLALIGAAMANKNKGRRIIAASIEHPSVYNPLLYLREQGFDVDFIAASHNGKVDEEDLAKRLDKDVIIVSIMYVNNEVGSVHNISRLSKMIKKHNKDIIFHVDAVQAYGKYVIRPKHEGIDLLSVSGHKIHGPKGIGFLYVDEKVKIKPVLFGGGQQKGMRSGTENIPSIIGLAEAVRECYDNLDKKIKQMYKLKRLLIEGLYEIEEVYVHAVSNDSEIELKDRIMDTAPHIVSASFKGIGSEILLNSLDNKGICVSSGSACAVNHKNISSVLRAIGVKEDLLDSAIRFSFSFETTKEEINYTLEQLAGIVPLLRKYKKK